MVEAGPLAVLCYVLCYLLCYLRFILASAQG